MNVKLFWLWETILQIVLGNFSSKQIIKQWQCLIVCVGGEEREMGVPQGLDTSIVDWVSQ